jgi:hypothetical protein
LVLPDSVLTPATANFFAVAILLPLSVCVKSMPL